MIALISPAKTLDFSPQTQTQEYTLPRFADDAAYLINKLQKLSAAQIGKLMSINNELAQLNYQRFQEWSLPFTAENAKQALLAFRGDVYRGLAADDFSQDDLDFAQEHLRILSGLYGVLRPLDLMQPYRLEMGSRFKVTPTKTNLYKYWDQRIRESLLADAGNEPIINLASQEYFKAVVEKHVPNRIIHCHFRDWKNGQYKSLQTYAKLGRGYMTRYIIKNRINDPEQLKLFNEKNYSFNAGLSNENEWVFTREIVEL
ncbi:MAG: peroxide stress protein YaaA [Flavobacteriales bacterium]|nr:peroxide stress protein YaaA [Flavobacteriales bacterium]